MSQHSITQQDLEALADTYDKIRQVFNDKSLASDKVLTKDLENHLRICISELSDKLLSNSPNEVLELYAWYSRYKLYGVCMNKVSELLEFFSLNSGKLLAEVVEKMNEFVEKIVFEAVNSIENKDKVSVDAYQTQRELDQVLRAAEGLEENILVTNI